jgi:hypothetical protein
MKQFISNVCDQAIAKRLNDVAVKNYDSICSDISRAIQTAVEDADANASSVAVTVYLLDVDVPASMGQLRTALYALFDPENCETCSFTGVKAVRVTLTIELKTGKVKTLAFVPFVVPDVCVGTLAPEMNNALRRHVTDSNA